MSNYTRGDYREKRAKEFLESYGWTVWQTRQSRTPADLVCLSAHHPPMLVQVKAASRITSEEWNALYTLATNLDAVPVVVTCTGRNPHISMCWRQILGLHEWYAHEWASRPIFVDDA